ncbi:NAD(P)-binding protein [Periconia macrospinosa]|uniref:NAD(P)-binding protein n=1 Tax=Periconia macrospinosa TaxID=97972 RepID=A0A2V1D1W2_9PLEO|nr:NAD(P)-binding protein [Periconia macrospinosa]
MASFGAFLSRQFFGVLPEPKHDLTGQTVIVTGSNVGLGKEAARHFVRLGASTVILAVRTVSKGEAAKADIEKSEGKSGVLQVWPLNMSSYESVIEFAARAQKELERIDIAVLNAGIVTAKWNVHEQDESTITVNVVSTFLLALSLFPKMSETASKFNKRPTLTLVTSDVHYRAKFVEGQAPEGKLFEALNKKPEPLTEGAMMERYQVSKLLDLLGTRAIADRKSAALSPVTVNCVSPGLCHS